MQAQLHQVQLELDSVRQALDEESAARSEAEHKLSLANTEISQWKSKFDAEVSLHHEEVEDLRSVFLLPYHVIRYHRSSLQQEDDAEAG